MATSINAMEVPVSTVQSATAASYAIPANRYAIVRAQVKNGGSLNIGGVTVLTSYTWATPALNVSPRVVSQSGALGNMLNVIFSNSGGNAFGATTNGSQQNSSVAFSDAGAMWTANTASTSPFAYFKVPTGTVIVGSGDARYHIELYKIPGASS
jgi:hypothetical protein